MSAKFDYVGCWPSLVVCRRHTYKHRPLEENRKGKEITAAAIDLCLKKLQLDYVDLMLIHSPCTTIGTIHA